MGTLVIKRIEAFFSQPILDHTYVECGTGGHAWSCFGRKTGGKPIATGSGSSRQANEIAEMNERGGIRCYAINGVCHQAANRIAFPAKILCLSAHGYGLSEAIYGPYGRPSGPLGLCPSPFNQHGEADGDLPECAEPARAQVVQQPTAIARTSSPRERQYIDRALEIYDLFTARPGMLGTALSDDHRTELGVRLFLHKAQFNLGANHPQAMLENHFREFDKPRLELEREFQNRALSASEFSIELNRAAIGFQERLANALPADRYARLLDVKPGDWTALTNPDLVEQAYKTP